MVEVLRTGIEAFEAVPMALYCFLRHPHAFADAVREAIFIGGDTDTIASMTGAIAGAFHGVQAISPAWLAAVREATHTPEAIATMADRIAHLESIESMRNDAASINGWPVFGSLGAADERLRDTMRHLVALPSGGRKLSVGKRSPSRSR